MNGPPGRQTEAPKKMLNFSQHPLRSSLGARGGAFLKRSWYSPGKNFAIREICQSLVSNKQIYNLSLELNYCVATIFHSVWSLERFQNVAWWVGEGKHLPTTSHKWKTIQVESVLWSFQGVEMSASTIARRLFGEEYDSCPEITEMNLRCWRQCRLDYHLL